MSIAETREQMRLVESDVERRNFAVALEKKWTTLLLPIVKREGGYGRLCGRPLVAVHGGDFGLRPVRSYWGAAGGSCGMGSVGPFRDFRGLHVV
jgi:hypothetical protein